MRKSARIFTSLIAAILLASCGGGQWVVPIDPPRPGPVPPSPVPPAPPPTPPAVVASAENVARVVLGMTKAQVDAVLGTPSSFFTRQDDGTSLAEYPAVDETNKAVYLEVHFNSSLKVTGRSRIPRAVPPEPTASLSAGELHLEKVDLCPSGVCRVPGR